MYTKNIEIEKENQSIMFNRKVKSLYIYIHYRFSNPYPGMVHIFTSSTTYLHPTLKLFNYVQIEVKIITDKKEK